MFEAQTNSGYHLQIRENTAPPRPGFLLNQHVLETPQRQPRTFSRLLPHCLRLKPTKFNPFEVCQLSIRTSGAKILRIQPSPSLEQCCQYSSNHRPSFLPLMKTTGKVATTFVDFKFYSGFTTSRTFVLQPSSKRVLGHGWCFHSSCFMYLLCL
jgi:hypothetical protein